MAAARRRLPSSTARSTVRIRPSGTFAYFDYLDSREARLVRPALFWRIRTQLSGPVLRLTRWMGFRLAIPLLFCALARAASQYTIDLHDRAATVRARFPQAVEETVTFVLHPWAGYSDFHRDIDRVAASDFQGNSAERRVAHTGRVGRAQ